MGEKGGGEGRGRNDSLVNHPVQELPQARRDRLSSVISEIIELATDLIFLELMLTFTEYASFRKFLNQYDLSPSILSTDLISESI